MSLKKLLRRTKRTVGDTVEDVTEQVNRARAYLETHAPALTEAGSAAQRVGEAIFLRPDVYRERHPNASLLQPLKDVTTVGHNLVGEPAAYGVNRLTGGDPGGGPFSDRNLAELGQRGIAGRAAQLGLETASDPLTWIPTGKAPALVQLGLGAAGIGDFGGRTVAQKLTRNLVAGAGLGAGQAAAAELTDNPLAQLAGGIAGMGLGLTAAGRTPGLRNVVQAEPRPTPRDFRDTLLPTEQLAREQAEEAARRAAQQAATRDAGGFSGLVRQLDRRLGTGAAVRGAVEETANSRRLSPLDMTPDEWVRERAITNDFFQRVPQRYPTGNPVEQFTAEERVLWNSHFTLGENRPAALKAVKPIDEMVQVHAANPQQAEAIRQALTALPKQDLQFTRSIRAVGRDAMSRRVLGGGVPDAHAGGPDIALGELYLSAPFRSQPGTQGIQDVVAHEVGHNIYSNLPNILKERWSTDIHPYENVFDFANWANRTGRWNPTSYAATNAAEDFAESYRIYRVKGIDWSATNADPQARIQPNVPVVLDTSRLAFMHQVDNWLQGLPQTSPENAHSLTPLGMGGPQLLKREIGAALLGGGAGAYTSRDAETTEDRLAQITGGAATAVLGTSLVTRAPARTLLRKMGAAARANPMQAVTNPSALADPAVREVAEAGRGYREGWKGRAQNIIAPDFQRQIPVLEAGVTIKPDILQQRLAQLAEAAAERPFVPEAQVARTRTRKDGTVVTLTDKAGNPLMKKVAAQEARAARPDIVEQGKAWIGDYRDVLQHPDFYDFTPEAAAVLPRMKAVFDAQLRREMGAGVWDRFLNRMNKAAGEALRQRERLVGEPLAGRIGEIARVRQTAAREAERVRTAIGRQGEAFRKSAEAARARAEAARRRGGRLGEFAPGIARMDDLHKTALLRAEQAVSATDDWYTGQVEALAGRIDALRAKVDTARSAGVASGVLAQERARRAVDAAMDRFELSAIGAMTPRGTGKQYDAAVAKLRASLQEVAEREGVQAVDPILKDFDTLAKQADRLYTGAASVALAKTPDAATTRLTRVEQLLEQAGGKARAAVQDIRARGERIVAADADAFEAQARLADFRAELADRAAERATAPILKQAERRAAALEQKAARLDARATRYGERMREPVKNYVPQYYPEGDVAVARRTVTVGGEKGFQQDKVYPSYWEAILDGAQMLPKDSLDIVERRLASGAAAIAERGIVAELGRQLERGTGTIIPDFLLPSVDAKQYKALDDVRLVLSDTKATQRDLAHRLLNSAHLPPTMDQAQRQALVGRINRGDVQFYLKKDTANYLQNVLAGPTSLTDNVAANVLDQATSGLRAVTFGTDAAAVLLRGVGGMLQLATASLDTKKPLRGAGRAADAMGRALWDTTFGSRDHLLKSERYWKWGDKGLENLLPHDLSGVLDRPEHRLWVERFWEDVTGPVGAKVGGVAGARGEKAGRLLAEGPVTLEKWQWGSFLPTFKYYAAEAAYDILKGTKTFGSMSEDELMRYVAKRINTVTSGFSRLRAGVSQDAEWLGRQSLLSPNWTRGQVANLTDVTKAGPEGYLARRFWTGMATMGLGGAVGLSLLFSNDFSLDHIERLLDPTHPDSITNPKGRNFGRVEMPDGGFVNLFGSLTTLSRSILRPVASGVGETAENVQNGDALWEAIGGGIAAAFDWENTESIRDWVLDRKALHLGTLEDVVNNEDKRGYAITNAEGAWERLRDQMKYAVLTAPPAVFDVVLNARERAIPQLQAPNRAGLKEAASGFFGADYRPPPDDPAAIQEKVRAFLAEQGVNGGADPLGVYRRESGKAFSGEARQAFETANPDIQAYLSGKNQQAIDRRAKPVGREAANLYREKTRLARDLRDQAIRAAGVQHAASGDGDAYRRQVGDAWAAYLAQSEFLARDLLGETTLEAANQRLNRLYGNEEPEFAIDRAYDEYESIRTPAGDDSLEARDAMLEARRAYLEPGGTADQRYGAGFSQRLRARLRNKYQAIGGETYGRYFDAQQVMGDYVAIPGYLHVDAAAGRRAQAVVTRAQEMRRAGNPLPMAALIMTDPRGEPRDRVNALIILKAGNRVRNPRKKQFFQQHAREIMPFYSNVGWELLDRLGGEET